MFKRPLRNVKDHKPSLFTLENQLIAKLSPSQPANPQLGDDIALLSQLWGTPLHPE